MNKLAEITHSLRGVMKPYKHRYDRLCPKCGHYMKWDRGRGAWVCPKCGCEVSRATKYEVRDGIVYVGNRPIVWEIWYFPERLREYARERARHSYPGHFRPHVARLLIEMFTEEGGKVLDPMCGGGTTVVEAVKLGREVWGVDLSEEALECVRRRLGELRAQGYDVSKAHLLRADARSLPFESDFFDLVIVSPPWYMTTCEWGVDAWWRRSYYEYWLTWLEILRECIRVSRDVIAVILHDTRVRRHVYPTVALTILAGEQLGAKFWFHVPSATEFIDRPVTRVGVRIQQRCHEYGFPAFCREDIIVFRKGKMSEAYRRELGKVLKLILRI